MNRNKKNIFYSYLLLFAFLSGQIIVFTHYHKNTTNCKVISYKHAVGINHIHKSEIEKCLLCIGLIHKSVVIDELNTIALYRAISLSISLQQIKKYGTIKKYIKSRAPPFMYC
jgi:hypothetical protein